MDNYISVASVQCDVHLKIEYLQYYYDIARGFREQGITISLPSEDQVLITITEDDSIVYQGEYNKHVIEFVTQRHIDIHTMNNKQCGAIKEFDNDGNLSKLLIFV